MCQGSLCRRRWPSQLPSAPPHRASRHSGASRSLSGPPRSLPSLGPSPSLPPCSATHAGLPPTAGPGGPLPRRLPYLRLPPRPRRPPTTRVSASPRSAQMLHQEQRRLPRAASGCSKTPRGLRGSCGFSLPPTSARLRPIPLPANPRPVLRTGSAHSSPPSRPSDQVFRQKESNPESIVPSPSEDLRLPQPSRWKRGTTVHVSITRASQGGAHDRRCQPAGVTVCVRHCEHSQYGTALLVLLLRHPLEWPREKR